MQVNIIDSNKNMLEFEIIKADHTIPRLITDRLNEDKNVEFAAYKIEHPLVSSPKVIVKTKKGDPLDLVLEKIEEIKQEVVDFRKQFKDAVK